MLSSVTLCILNFLYLFYVATSTNVNSELYWVSNNAGLYSHFLQLKILFERSREVERSLVIVPSTSPHYHSAIMNMCDIFQLPNQIRCAELPSNVSCTDSFDKIKRKRGTDVCYSGSITFGKPGKGRPYVIRAVDFPLVLQFSDIFTLMANKFKTAFIHRADIVHHPTAFTVIHWRRGDQLQGRCNNRMDASVNCGDAYALVKKVREVSNNSVVYVATNEPQDSIEMERLRDAGFISFADVAGPSSSDIALQQLTVFEVLVAETVLMLSAQTFLGWGISEVNDVVEHARMQAGLSYCQAQEPPERKDQETWCSLRSSSLPRHR